MLITGCDREEDAAVTEKSRIYPELPGKWGYHSQWEEHRSRRKLCCFTGEEDVAVKGTNQKRKESQSINLEAKLQKTEKYHKRQFCPHASLKIQNPSWTRLGTLL